MVETAKLVIKILMKMQNIKIFRIILKKSKVKELKPVDIKTYYKAKVIKIVWY